jgi:hypothetical protein
MRSKLALALTVAALLSACAQSPTVSATAHAAAPRFDDGGYLGSGGRTLIHDSTTTRSGGSWTGSGN